MPSTLEFQHDIPGLDPDSPAEPWITTTEEPRTLVLCFDGTGNELGDHNTNVAQFFKLLKGDDESQQKVYYQPGIGTSANPRLHTAFGQASSKALNMAVAWSIDSHIVPHFLVDNYKAGDKICLFGFSRGAYTARALAGMLHKVGLLRLGNTHDIDNAYDLYLRTDALASEDSAVFKDFYSINVDIQFIGVWDTVCSVGIPEKHFPFTASCPFVRTFRHALSLDERRVKFKADHHDASGLHKTDVKEVWFAGCHADVGGGSVANEEQHSLARISLRWMVRECVRTNTGIRFCNELLEDIGLDPETLYSRAEADIVHDPDFALARPLAVHSTEDVEEIKDALCTICDELALRPLWWIVEVAAMPWQEQLPKSKRNSKKSIR
ncbi:hypothetical protein K466DRAFT_489675 [Polyporus arcularius HHB13444]|uniref:T6SS Phospholipase effector Tle1-like catalytic domain-containing protein n=1 Tax=Polyporus arcularius HHB13444 TaxID=1314778 RepID=A0A5C3PIN1_9APHY|nr:hypothetical protein K466DRAFT_489675 [Polyporus arcularius HHB13444]